MSKMQDILSDVDDKLDIQLRTIIDEYGIIHQLKKLNEEVYELIEAIIAGNDAEAVEEEFADVLVLLYQIAEERGVDADSVRNMMRYKAERQIRRMFIGKEIDK